MIYPTAPNHNSRVIPEFGWVGHFPLYDQVRQKGTNFGCPHCGWMSLVMEEDEAFDPVHVGLFSPNAVVFEADSVPHLIEEFRLVVHPLGWI
jgi:hypothetical protein